MMHAAATDSSCPGLTRQSIIAARDLLVMDARVKPAHDEALPLYYNGMASSVSIIRLSRMTTFSAKRGSLST